MDYIDVYKENIIYLHKCDYYITIVQESIRFMVIKPIGVYIEGRYKGTFRIVEKEVFKIKDLSKIISLMVFGERKAQGLFHLRGLPIRGKVTENTEMAIVVLEYEKFEDKYDLNIEWIKEESYYYKDVISNGVVVKHQIHLKKCHEINLEEDEIGEGGRLIGHIGHYKNPQMACNDLKKYKENVEYCHKCIPKKNN